jgi:hypothetical protein
MNTIQTQPSTDGNFELSVVRTSIRGDVLTVQVIIKNIASSQREYEFNFKDIYYTDIKNRKKYYGLRDTKNIYIAGPVAGNAFGGYFRHVFQPGDQAIFWIKFPAPAEDTGKIDIYIPFALPFEDVTLKRQN